MLRESAFVAAMSTGRPSNNVVGAGRLAKSGLGDIEEYVAGNKRHVVGETGRLELAECGVIAWLAPTISACERIGRRCIDAMSRQMKVATADFRAAPSRQCGAFYGRAHDGEALAQASTSQGSRVAAKTSSWRSGERRHSNRPERYS